MAEKHLKKCSKSLVIREMQIKMNLRFHLTPIRMAKIKTSGDNSCWRGCGERGVVLHCQEDGKLVQPLWKSIWRFLRKLEIDLPENPAIPLLGIYPKDAPPRHGDTCSLCSQWPYMEQPETGNNLDVPQQQNGYRKCGSFSQWYTTQLLRTRTS